MNLSSILLLLALIAFIVAGVGIAVPRVNLIGIGLALWLAAMMLSGAK